MCLLINQKKKAKTLKPGLLKRSYDNNNDGAGFAYANNNKLVVKKYRDFETFNDAYQRLHRKHKATSAFLLHFRIGTHGSSNGTTNVHPFFVNENLVFAHNGVISNVRDDKKLSDTQVFNNDVLKHIKGTWIQDDAILYLIGQSIGHSKLVFLDNNGDFKIVNKHLGHWVGKTWFSNKSYEENTFDYGGCTTVYNTHYGNTVQSNQSKTYFGRINTHVPSPKPDVPTKQTRYKYEKDTCDECGQMSFKLRTDDDTDDAWYCGTCWKSKEY